MKFVDNVIKEDYIDFCKTRNDLCFMQSYEWGEFSTIGRGQTPVYIGLCDDDNKLVAASLLLKRITPLNMCYFYAPRGVIIDYKNKELLTIWTNELKNYLKKENAIYLKFDPELKYQTINESAEVTSGENNYDVYNNLINLGYKHTGFNRLFEHNQPRYSFRINLKNRDFKEIENDMSKTFMKTVKRSYYYDMEIIINDDIKKFHELITKISTKDDFNAYTYEYYQNLYDLFKKNDHIKLHSAVIYPDKIIEKIIIEKDALVRNADYDDKLKRINKDLETFLPLKDKYPDGLIVCSLITIQTDYGSWAMYIGNDEVGKHVFAINRLYYESIKWAHVAGLDFYDLFGTVGDPKTTYKNLAGIHEFKRKFGGEYIEFIGEFDLVNKPFWYSLLPKLLWIYRKVTKKRY